jgi:hypothetical protein
MKMRSLEALVAIAVASGVAVAGGDIQPKKEADMVAPVFTKAPYKYVKKPITADDGSLHGYLRMHHIFDGEDNGYDKVTGSTIGLGLGYGMEVTPGLKVGAEFYGVMDSGLTDTDETAIAYGQFMNEVKSPNELDAGYSWGAHIRYEGDGYKAQIARSQYDSPLTNIVQITHVPNMYEYARLDGKVLGGNASVGFINKMAYGSRSAADWGLIGEFTGTAGMFMKPFDTGAGAYLKRGDYYSIDETLTAGTTDSDGILQFGYEKKKGMWDFSVWDQYIDDVGNNIYAQGSYKWPLGKGKVVKLSGHVWNQNISNSAYEEKYGGTLVGAQALVKWGKFVGKLAYETKDDGGLLNAWGANPGYTSSIFSRNQYRSNVDAYKATLAWMPMKGLKFVASYADYGQSDMPTGGNIKAAPNDDADELDLVVVYKPRPDLSFKLFNANRTSEYNGAGGKERTMNHTRLIVNFAF